MLSPSLCKLDNLTWLCHLISTVASTDWTPAHRPLTFFSQVGVMAAWPAPTEGAGEGRKLTGQKAYELPTPSHLPSHSGTNQSGPGGRCGGAQSSMRGGWAEATALSALSHQSPMCTCPAPEQAGWGSGGSVPGNGSKQESLPW